MKMKSGSVLMSLLSVIVVASGCGEEGNEAAVVDVQPAFIIPNTQVGSGDPGGTFFLGQPVTAYSGTDTHINVIVNNSTKHVLTDTARGGASVIDYVTSFANTLVLAFVGTDSGHTLCVRTSTDGANWNSGFNLAPGHNERAPALAILDGLLWMMVQNTSGRVEFWEPNAGLTNWQLKFSTPDMASSDALTATPFTSGAANVLLLAWSTGGPSGVVRTRTYNGNGSTTGLSAVTIQGFSGNPSLASFSPGGVVMTTRSGNTVFARRSSDGISYTSPVSFLDPQNNNILVTTVAKPVAFAASASSVTFTWVGTNAGRSLNEETFTF